MPNLHDIATPEAAPERARESALRRRAARQGYRLTKSRRRDPQAPEYGRFWLVTPERWLVAGELFGLDLDEVADELRRRE